VIANDLTEPRRAPMEFDAFVADGARRVRRALVAFYGLEIGGDAADEAIAVAWEKWAVVGLTDDPAAYVFRIGQSKARPHLRWRARRTLFSDTGASSATVDVPAAVDLLRAIERLRPQQRAAVMLVKSYGYSHREVAALLGVSESVVNNLVHRGVRTLRTLLEVRS
jgi:DNA-directed RNA polymerase specialized sigma24 family protein